LNHTTFPSLADYATAREATLQFIERTPPTRVFVGFKDAAPKILEVKDPTGSSLNMAAIVTYAVDSGAEISLVEVKPSQQWIDHKTAEFLEMLRCRPGIQLISFDIASNPSIEDIMKQIDEQTQEMARQTAMVQPPRFTEQTELERVADEVELTAKNMGSEDERLLFAVGDRVRYIRGDMSERNGGEEGEVMEVDVLNGLLWVQFDGDEAVSGWHLEGCFELIPALSKEALAGLNPMQKIGEFLAAGRTKGSTAVSAQPAPVDQGRASAHDLVAADLAERKAFGLAKYGQTLQAHNGRDTLQDLYEELLDATCYMRTLIEERKVR